VAVNNALPHEAARAVTNFSHQHSFFAVAVAVSYRLFFISVRTKFSFKSCRNYSQSWV